jgi:predicted RNA binding protein YcfA (HicA-like mRNA interferase family)
VIYLVKISRNLKGKDLIKILVNKYGWVVRGQDGSHATLKKEGEPLLLTVPCHADSLKPGTLLSILKKAKIDYEEFYRQK